MIRFLLISALLSALSTSVLAQVKIEREYRLETEEVPTTALEFVQSLEFSKKVKWYKEEGFNRHSIEAKTKHLSRNYSIEFKTDGELEDLEIEIQAFEIPDTVRDGILDYLNQQYDKVKLGKIQIQFPNAPELIRERVFTQNFAPNHEITGYEIVMKVKDKGRYQQMEYLFDYQGRVLNRAIIIEENTDNIEY